MNQKDFDALQKLINLCSNDNSDCGQKVIGKRARNVDSANHEILSGTTQEMVELSSNGNILTIASASALLENLGTVTTYYISLVASLASSQESHEHQQIFLYYYLILLRKVLRYAFTTVDTPTTTLDDILTLLLRTWKQLKDSATSLGHSFVELSLEFIDNYINVSSGLNYSLVNETFSSVFRVISKEMRALCINTDAVDDKNSSFFISGNLNSHDAF
ncbi:hypothetical protein EON65_43425 [archaeon]|nr:MAG: hypothetical protein EON65_43425 [archaeon]